MIQKIQVHEMPQTEIHEMPQTTEVYEMPTVDDKEKSEYPGLEKLDKE
jgi:hypothetical protein